MTSDGDDLVLRRVVFCVNVKGCSFHLILSN